MVERTGMLIIVDIVQWILISGSSKSLGSIRQIDDIAHSFVEIPTNNM